MKAVIVVVLALVASCYSLPDGAPLQACQDLTPQHGVAPMPNPSPYEIDLSDFVSSYGALAGSLTYLPGAYYTITLQARNVSVPATNLTSNMTGNATTFRGFLIQARDMNGMPVGEFQDPSGQQPLTRLSSCDPPTISVTHNNPGPRAMRVDMESATFTWRAPTTVTTGPIQFFYTTVQVFDTFWVAESTAQIQEVPLTCPGMIGGGAGSISSLGVWALLGTALIAALKVTF